MNPMFAGPDNGEMVAHELFHVLQFGVYRYASGWLMESTAHWAERELNPQRNDSEGFYLLAPEDSLDCVLAACRSTHGDRGYNRWLFWSYLANLYGRGIVQETFEYRRPSATEAIDAVLAKRGSSLARAYGDFAVATLLLTYPGAARTYPRVSQHGLAAAASATITLDHLATTYLALQRPSKACTTKALHVRVTAPAAGGNVTLVIDKRVVGSGPSIDVTWKTCKSATLVLSNTSLVDGQAFALQTSTSSRAT